MLNRVDFFALLLFQVLVTFALSRVMQERNCAQCELGVTPQAIVDQWVLVEN